MNTETDPPTNIHRPFIINKGEDDELFCETCIANSGLNRWSKEIES